MFGLKKKKKMGSLLPPMVSIFWTLSSTDAAPWIAVHWAHRPCQSCDHTYSISWVLTNICISNSNPSPPSWLDFMGNKIWWCSHRALFISLIPYIYIYVYIYCAIVVTMLRCVMGLSSFISCQRHVSFKSERERSKYGFGL